MSLCIMMRICRSFDSPILLFFPDIRWGFQEKGKSNGKGVKLGLGHFLHYIVQLLLLLLSAKKWTFLELFCKKNESVKELRDLYEKLIP